ncbi:M28 family metallopeptidase [Hymenobacter nivis]|uniref:M20/M25/M40 family metallo-hydrolase n=1 Tax=Hymenobacter nivis TaxID=1850093 RepID=A0A502GIL9_9BACT|nr:M28 family metallopeptidase [Hymenobacter nivis]TPG61704.1 M20/M25/M40 family metallo-hydrolase [Hymenobacter nivis]
MPSKTLAARPLPALLLALAVATGCQSKPDAAGAAAATTAAAAPAASAAPDAITAADISGYLKTVAADEMLGRKPFTAGEERITAYLAAQFKALGLKPGGPGGSYFQPVPMVEITAAPAPTMQISGPGKSLALAYKTDYVLFTQREQPLVEVKNSSLVFAGYGVVAPEYGWDDYAGLDVKGKTVVVLVNDPGNAGTDSTLFKGRAMTYYGRWTYKYEEAARHGAAGLLIVHDTQPAAYPWSVVLSGAVGPKLRPQTPDHGASKCALEGWLTLAAAKRLFAAAGQDYDALYAAANRRGFRPRALGLTMSTSLQNKLRRQTSKNVLAVLPGTTNAGEYIIYSAHWDHFGVGKTIAGDSIYNGAVDDGTGLAALLSIAKAFKETPTKPARSVVFLAVTGEEQGLLGSAYYAQHPPFPLAKTVADLNMDMLWPYGRMKDLTVIGAGQSELEDYARAAAQEQGRYLLPDQTPETGMFYRSDHFSFAHVGVPSLYASGGFESRAQGKAYIADKRKAYTTSMYHKPADQFDLAWDLAGVAQDAQLYFRVGQRLAAETTFPQWRAGSEFKGIREKAAGK